MNNYESRIAVWETINRVYKNGLTSTSGGNISAMSDDGTVFITPSGKDKGTLLPEDIAEVRPNGEIIGKFVPSIELPFHKKMYALRPDVKGIVHAHAPAAVAYALCRKVPQTDVTPLHAALLKNLVVSDYAIPGSLELGDIVSDCFARGASGTVMSNHGATTCGADLNEAYLRYEALNDACEICCNAAAFGGVRGVNFSTDYGKDYPLSSEPMSADELNLCKGLAAFVRRSFEMKLLSNYCGTLAHKTADGAVLLNRHGLLRENVTEQGFVKIKDGMATARGKEPYLGLIEEILDKCDGVNTVFVSLPKAVMGFAAAHEVLDTSLLPESYIALRQVGRIEYGASADKIAEKLSLDFPGIVVDNECAVTVGNSVVKTFDRMEVLDYSARSLIAAKKISEVYRIGDCGIQDIEKTFFGA